MSRARKTTKTPARIWKYGLPFGPIRDDRELVNDQIYRSRLFHNDLIALAIETRQAYREARSRIVPGYAEAESIVANLLEQKAELDAEIKATNMEARKKGAATPEQKRRKKKVAAALKAARNAFAPLKAVEQEVTEARKRAKSGGDLGDISDASRQLMAASDAINADRAKKTAELRVKHGECSWGTRGRVEAAVRQSSGGKTDPVFRRWDGSGNVAVQILSSSKRLYTEGLLACEDTRLRLELTEFKRGRQRAMLWLRVGSEGRQSTPVWAKFECVYHRPLPPGAEIKAAWAQRRRIGPGRWRWEACLQLESEEFEPPARIPSHACSVNLGWRGRPGGRIRVAYVVGTDGHSEEYLLPTGVVERLDHAEGNGARGEEARSLKSLRDKKFNSIRDELVQWLGDQDGVPEWLRKETTHLARWRSPARLVVLRRKWMDQRFDGDAEMFDRIDHWKRREWHLHRWQSGESESARGHRKDQYRVFARRLAERYSDIVFQEFDLSVPQRKRAPGEDEDEQSAKQRLNRTRAALSELRGALLLAASNTGARVTALKPVTGVSVSSSCHVCGHKCEFDRRSKLVHRCERCGAEWDQDENHCRNLLAFRTAEAAE